MKDSQSKTNLIAEQEIDKLESLMNRIKDGDISQNELLKELSNRKMMIRKIKDLN